MIATQQEIAELHQFFDHINVPKTLKINKAVTFLDLPTFVKENLQKLSNNSMSDIVGKPRYEDLLSIKKVLISGEEI